MVLGSTLPLKEMSTRGISWDKGGRCVWLTTLPPCARCLEIWEPQNPGTLWAYNRPVWGVFTFTFTYHWMIFFPLVAISSVFPL